MEWTVHGYDSVSWGVRLPSNRPAGGLIHIRTLDAAQERFVHLFSGERGT